jgi:hypothetical protein
MEVHHHPHVEKKNFKEYFFEFLMIFLAVTLGFFAESLRESINDRAKAKDYITSFYEDLKADATQIAEVLRFDDEKIDGLGNIDDCYDTVLQNSQSGTCLFRIMKNSISNRPFQITDRTVQQLSNSGGYRLLKKEDADTISTYLKDFTVIRDFQTTGFQQAQEDVRKTMMLLIRAC